MPAVTPLDEEQIREALSSPRAQTYIAAAHGDTARAVALYGWNARVSASMMLPAHFAEVTTRNAVADALEQIYGPRWPWSTTFENSLPSPRGRVFNPRRNLTTTRDQEPTTGKVIAELKFVFWQGMFTSRHDGRVWNPRILDLFPNTGGLTPQQTRSRIYNDLEAIRQLRNRIAHHEPIFTRNLADDLSRMLDLIELRSAATAHWVRAMEDTSAILAERP